MDGQWGNTEAHEPQASEERLCSEKRQPQAKPAIPRARSELFARGMGQDPATQPPPGLLQGGNTMAGHVLSILLAT